jgi:hypothetical protein
VCEDLKALRCKECKEFNLLTVTVREWKTGKGGWVERVLLRGLLVSANDLLKIGPAAHG